MNKTGVLSIIAMVVLVIALGLSYKGIMAGRDAEDWDKQCIEGQTVFVMTYVNKIAAINKLNPDGTPVKCGVK